MVMAGLEINETRMWNTAWDFPSLVSASLCWNLLIISFVHRVGPMASGSICIYD